MEVAAAVQGTNVSEGTVTKPDEATSNPNSPASQQQLYDVSMSTADDSHKSIVEESSRRLRYMDSLRGILAVVVVYHHFRCAFDPCAMFGATVAWVSDISVCEKSPIPLFGNSFTNGTFSVGCFFILSGFCVSHKLWTADLETWRVAVAKRFLRLAIPCAVAVVFAYALAGWRVHQRAAYITGSLWLERLGMDRPSPVTGLLSQMFLGVWHGNITLNNALWTMKFELFASYLAFLAVIIIKRSSHTPRTLSLLAVVLYFLAPATDPVDELHGRIRYTQSMALPGHPGQKVKRNTIQHTVRLDLPKHSHVLRQLQEFATAGNPQLQTVTFDKEEFVDSNEIQLDHPQSWWQTSNAQVYRDLLHAAEHGYAGFKEFSPPVVDIVHSRTLKSKNPFLWYAAFFFGVWLSERAKVIKRRSWPGWAQCTVGLLTFLCASYPYTVVMASEHGMWYLMMQLARNFGYHEAHEFYSVIAAGLAMMYMVEGPGVLRTMLSNQPYLVLLGKLSFSLYLTHIPILFTVSCQVFLYLHAVFGEDIFWANLGTFLISVPVMIGTALVFWTFVDEPSIQWSQQMARDMLGLRSKVMAADPIPPAVALPMAPNLEASETSEGSSSSS